MVLESSSVNKKVLQAVNKENTPMKSSLFHLLYFYYLKDLIHKSQTKLGAQNVSAFKDGAYTGEISGSMLKTLE